MAHEINPEQDNPLIEIGKLIHDESYSREKKGFETPGMKIDLIKKEHEQIVVGEVKKSSKFLNSAMMQLAFYLYRLKELGIPSKGELLIPREKKRITVELSSELEVELKNAFSNIEKIVKDEKPPPPQRIRFCANCAYKDFCWV